MALAAAWVAVLVGCGMEEIKSTWLDRQETRGGSHDDPQQSNARHFIAKGEAVLDIFNDEKTLLLQISTRNQNLHRQLSTAGLTVWFDETGGTKKRYGLRFPSGRPSRGKGETQQGNLVDNRVEAGRDVPFSPDERNNTDNIEITGPGENEYSRISSADSKLYGIQYRTEGAGGYFVHELRMPLIRNVAAPYGIARHTPKLIGICLESSQKENSRIDTGITVEGGGRGGGGPQGGGPRGGDREDGQGPSGGMGGPSQGGAGRGDGGQEMRGEPLKLWLKVHLAVKPAYR